MGVLVAFVIDLVATLIFAITGRASHAENLDLAGIVLTWWPFLVALVAGWIVSLAWRRPFGIVRPGILIWIVTVAGGMLLRLASGQGAAVAFIIVATITLGVFLLGWRGIRLLVVAVRGRRSVQTER